MAENAYQAFTVRFGQRSGSALYFLADDALYQFTDLDQDPPMYSQPPGLPTGNTPLFRCRRMENTWQLPTFRWANR